MKKPKKKRRRFVLLVDWVDSYSEQGWRSNEEVKKMGNAAPIQSVGFLVKETKRAITLALSRTKDDAYRPVADVITIPKVSIKRRQVLRRY